MIRRNTWILLGVFAVALAMVWAIPFAQSKLPKSASTPTRAPQSLFGVGATFSEVTVKNAAGQTITIQQSGGQWSIAEPKELKLANDQISAAVDALASMTIQSDLPVQPPADAMGLTSPADTITAKLSSGETKVIQVGNPTVTGSGYYVQLQGSPAITVSKYSLESVLKLFTEGTPTPTATIEAAVGTETPASSSSTQVESATATAAP